ncbi:bifunctional riboflavin kinase/FAD synthetase [Dermatophilus congolensis]|uniref:Riboflavin biosynthesis protein n=1 Tax=Dermatophilus congolensis TaxID=1863 RepID=A0AA46GZT1_9MICO|nr:bifunctional riboflavin kinase/FAD synthetase [Dermatophilus congolensis]MBO3142312.1 bifunctional riboflavin kinase/FAD synthetase [Dermatophilus congolensis]MBO3151303.1 bifunctional riboflavin kinase/FAD synthetase [Dermatophilus congolensis]MBO3161693.1 bifunctional riboflavin kinase/FAD synthetase [Dermatophilus congolensis]MBO3162589.1 bifunctional riboflavin kinase/FAD synthetase [Dermatophilus congolensis]MBO3176142.1 bifunctional riboflavin kinase/FAD synthetase [Dermatophilus cong
MLRWNQVSDLPADLGPTAVTIGTFDGVHRGHRAVLSALNSQAASRGVTSVAITFAQHPLAVLRPEDAPEMVCSTSQRLDRMADSGLGGVLVLDFTAEFAQLSPREFVQQVIVEGLNAKAVILGRDSRFGHRNAGDVETMRALGEEFGFETVVLDDVGVCAGSEAAVQRWSSSMTRDFLARGEVGEAAKVLGRPHVVSGEVVHGDHRGRELGYPTANLSTDSEGLVPADGVYAGWLIRPGMPVGSAERMLPTAISVGTNPTFEGTQRRVEAYVLDRTDLDLYGERVNVEFVKMLRPTLKFDSVEELLECMEQDVAQTRQILSSVVPSV